MEERCLLRTMSSISFTGVLFKDIIIDDIKGVMIKMSEKSNVRIWCPYDEIESIIFPDGKVLNKSEFSNQLL